MFVRAAFPSVAISLVMVLFAQVPAHADWADSLTTQVLRQVVRQEVNRWVRQKMNGSSHSSYSPSQSTWQSSQYNKYDQPAPQDQQLPPAVDPTSASQDYPLDDGPTPSKPVSSHAHRSVSRTVHNQQYDNVDIPPPPPSSEYGMSVPPPPSGLPAAGAINGFNTDKGGDVEIAAPGSPAHSNKATSAFANGTAGELSFNTLVHSGVFVSCPMSGGIHNRTDEVKYIILHSTETASPADARRVIHSWSIRGANHPGAQFVVDRDGTIYATTDPDLVATHINVHKALNGYTNENSIGIEIVRAGKQHYTEPQLSSVLHLVAYLQDHYGVPDSNVTTHAHVQPSDRSDPVGFNMIAFEHAKSRLRTGDTLASTPKNSPAFTTKMPPLAPTFHRHHAS